MHRLALVLLLVFTMAGCATVPMANTQDDAAGKAFHPPPPGLASLYVYRESIFGAAYTLSLSMGQRLLGTLAPDTWFKLDVEPGQYDMRCTAENTASTPLAIAAGETRYVETAVRMGLMAPRCAIFEVTSEVARPAILRGKRAAEIK